MLNWCENDLTVEGPKEVLEEFLKFAAGESPFDFNRFVPYPEDYQRLEDAAEAWHREHAGAPHQERSAPPKDGYSSGGYAWCLTHWGTKWPADHVDVEGPVTVYDEKTLQVVFHFDTAWRPPTPVIAKAAKLYPALSLDLRYFESGCGFNGIFRCGGGEVLPDESGRYFGSRGG
jgi:hypothetical protein